MGILGTYPKQNKFSKYIKQVKNKNYIIWEQAVALTVVVNNSHRNYPVGNFRFDILILTVKTHTERLVCAFDFIII